MHWNWTKGCRVSVFTYSFNISVVRWRCCFLFHPVGALFTTENWFSKHTFVEANDCCHCDSILEVSQNSKPSERLFKIWILQSNSLAIQNGMQVAIHLQSICNPKWIATRIPPKPKSEICNPQNFVFQNQSPKFAIHSNRSFRTRVHKSAIQNGLRNSYSLVRSRRCPRFLTWFWDYKK